MDNLKDLIINALNEGNLSYGILKDYLGCDDLELNDALNDLLEEKRIKYLPSQELYKLIKFQGLDLALLLDFCKKKMYFTYFDIKKHFKAKKAEIDSAISILSKEEKIKFINEYNVYSYLLEGQIDLHEKFGFVTVDGYTNDFFIPGDFIYNAYNKDIVLIAPVEVTSKKIVAKVIKVLKRNTLSIFGILKEKGTKYKKYYVIPLQNSFNQNVIIKGDINKEDLGKVCQVSLEYRGFDVTGRIINVIGYKDDPGMDISLIALKYGFEVSFKEDTIKELDNIPDEVLDYQLKDRIDYTNKKVITIDGDDSKDFDDAVSLEIMDNGNYKLGVYIADVAEYVVEGTSLDKDALKRGTSCYLADRVIPMLPRKLSNGICSLNPNVIRLVLAIIIEINPKGKVIGYDINEGYIKSCHRMTYNKVNKILDGDNELINEYNDIYDMLIQMNKLSHILRDIRFRRGGLEFDDTEFEFKLNDKGEPIEIIRRQRYDAEKLIEDFMLIANEMIAYHMNLMKLPIVYRIHEEPDQEKLHQTIDVIRGFDLNVKNLKGDIHPKEIQEILSKAKENPNTAIINNLMLRSMMKAKYFEDCLGHYGLALHYYCHFTSPIRRYPDLMTHRMIKKLLLHPTNNIDSLIKKYNEIIPDIAYRNSKSERNSIDCEREVDDMLYAWYMEKHIGEDMIGVIVSMMPYGMFVELSNGAEGLISFQSMDGYYTYDEDTYTASNGIKTYRLGDKVEIVITNSDKDKHQIDFMLKEDYLRMEI